MIKNILVAVDGSENSMRALDFALELAEKFVAALTILNVSQTPAVGSVSMDPTAALTETMIDFSRDFEKLHISILNEAVSYAKQAKPNLKVSSKLKDGDPAKEIVSTAGEGGFDVVVVGHRGVGRVREMFLGSVSEKVAHSALCPVIIVR